MKMFDSEYDTITEYYVLDFLANSTHMHLEMWFHMHRLPFPLSMLKAQYKLLTAYC